MFLFVICISYEIIVLLDSVASAEREINIFFSDFNIKKWYEHDEKYYNLGQIHFDPVAFLHTIDASFVNTNKEQITK